MAKAKEDHKSVIYSTDMQCMELMANYLCDREENGDQNLDFTKKVVVEAMNRLSVHGLEYFDAVIANQREKRKEEGV